MKRTLLWTSLCYLCLALGPFNSLAWAEPDSQVQDDYDRQVDRAEGYWDSADYDRALELYREILLRQRELCRRSQAPVEQVSAAMSRTSPCWRMMMMQFNVALTLAKKGGAKETLAGFRGYLQRWKQVAPKMSPYPFEARAYFEMGRALQRLNQHAEALRYFRKSLQHWAEHHPQKRASFEADAQNGIASALEAMKAPEKATDKPQPTRKPQPEGRRWSAWATAGVVTGGLALGSEAVALGLTVAANNEFNDTTAFRTARAGVVGGHVVAGVLAVASAVCFYLHFRRPAADADDAERFANGLSALTWFGGRADDVLHVDATYHNGSR